MKKLCKFILTLAVLNGVLFGTGLASAAGSGAHDGADDEVVVEVKPSSTFKVRRAVLFPFQVPQYVFKIVTYPLGKGLELMDEHRVTEKVSNFLTNKKKTAWFYPMIDWGAGSSFGGGAGYTNLDLFDRGYHFDVHYTIHIDLNQYAGLEFKKPGSFDLFGRPASWTVKANFMREMNSDFYGIGADSSLNNHGLFTTNDIIGRFILSWEFHKHLFIELAAGFEGASTFPYNSGSEPSVNDVFPPGQILGFNRWEPYFIFNAALQNNDLDDKLRPSKGGVRKITLSRYQMLEQGDYDYDQLDIELKQYFTPFSPGYTFMLRNAWVFQNPDSGNNVPFYKLATLDADHMLRGFDRGRFKDVSSVVFNIEYYFPLWRGTTGILLFDTGRVFHRAENFSLNDFRFDGGGGFDMKFYNFIDFRFLTAYGGEGVKFLINLSKVL